MNWLEKSIMAVAPGLSVRRLDAKSKALRLDSQIRRYEGATKGIRGEGFKGAQGESANQDIRRAAPTLRERSRDLYNNTTGYKRAVKVIVNNVVRTGILPTPTGKVKFVKRVKSEWKQWGEKLTCDFNDKLNFYGLTKLFMRTYLLSGEAIAVRKHVPSSVNKLGIQILILEPEYLDRTKDIADIKGGKGYTQGGIQYDADGRVEGYWLFDRHPREHYAKSNFVKKKDVIHMHDVDRPGQNGGVPLATNTILAQRDLDEYLDGEIMAKKAGAAFAGVITTPDPEKLDGDIKDEDYDKDLRSTKLTPGSFYKIYPGEDVQFTSPPMSPNFEAFVRVFHRNLATGQGVTYEQYTGDYSQVNFTSGRMGLMEFVINVEDWQWIMLIPTWCDGVYNWFMEGVLIQVGYTQLPDDFSVTWTTPRREMIDPWKEVKALKEELAGGLVTWDEVVRRRGEIPDEVFEELQKTYDKFKKSGLPIDWLQPKGNSEPPVDDTGEGDDEEVKGKKPQR